MKQDLNELVVIIIHLTDYRKPGGGNSCVISSRPAVVVLVLLLVLTCVCTVVTLIYVVCEMRDMRGQLATLSQSVSSSSTGKIPTKRRS